MTCSRPKAWPKRSSTAPATASGLSVHEEPYIVAGNDLPLEEGMAFSVEPGIYFPGQWGARIEDIVVVTADGALPVNNRPHELVVVPAGPGATA